MFVAFRNHQVRFCSHKNFLNYEPTVLLGLPLTDNCITERATSFSDSIAQAQYCILQAGLFLN